MTAQQMLNELAADLGNRTYLTPNGVGQDRLLQWLNWGLLEVCGLHRKRAFNPQYFKALEAKALWSTSILTGTVAAAASNTVTLAAAHTELAANFYQDWVIALTAYDEDSAGSEAPEGLLNQAQVIVGYNPATNQVTTAEAWTATPDAYTTYTLYKRIYNINTDCGINPSTTLYGIQALEQAANGNKLTNAHWTQCVGESFSSLGTPGKFARRGNNLILSPTPDSAIYFRLWYYRYPTMLTVELLDQECELDTQWHEVVVQGALARGFESLMEPDRAAEAYAKFRDMHKDRRSNDAVEGDYRAMGFQVRRS